MPPYPPPEVVADAHRIHRDSLGRVRYEIQSVRKVYEAPGAGPAVETHVTGTVWINGPLRRFELTRIITSPDPRRSFKFRTKGFVTEDYTLVANNNYTTTETGFWEKRVFSHIPTEQGKQRHPDQEIDIYLADITWSMNCSTTGSPIAGTENLLASAGCTKSIDSNGHLVFSQEGSRSGSTSRTYALSAEYPFYLQDYSVLSSDGGVWFSKSMEFDEARVGLSPFPVRNRESMYSMTDSGVKYLSYTMETVASNMELIGDEPRIFDPLENGFKATDHVMFFDSGAANGSERIPLATGILRAMGSGLEMR